jgi:hypothetical protein
MIVCGEEAQVNSLLSHSLLVRYNWDPEVDERRDIFRQPLWRVIRESHIFLVHNHEHLEVNVVWVLPIRGVNKPDGVSSRSIAFTWSSKFHEGGDSTKGQLIRGSILEELIYIVGDFTNRISDCAFDLDYLSCRDII